jgi:two-component system nitrogen regulation response regulator NtrX
MVIGPSGSGKELAARAIHALSSRKSGPFVTVKRRLDHAGAYGDRAVRDGGQWRPERKVGRAGGGASAAFFTSTRSADMPRETQAKILRVLVDQQFERVGGSKRVKVDVRIISSSPQNLEQMIRQGRFSEDLYHRLAVVPVMVPPLAERREDIPFLVDHFMRQIR